VSRGDVTDVVRCDYCGQYAAVDSARTVVEFDSVLDDGRYLWLPAVYCSDYCGRTATNRAGAVRG
jgi:hypothetical protein